MQGSGWTPHSPVVQEAGRHNVHAEIRTPILRKICGEWQGDQALVPFSCQSLSPIWFDGRLLATTPLGVRMNPYSVAKRTCRD